MSDAAPNDRPHTPSPPAVMSYAVSDGRRRPRVGLLFVFLGAGILFGVAATGLGWVTQVSVCSRCGMIECRRVIHFRSAMIFEYPVVVGSPARQRGNSQSAKLVPGCLHVRGWDVETLTALTDRHADGIRLRVKVERLRRAAVARLLQKKSSR